MTTLSSAQLKINIPTLFNIHTQDLVIIFIMIMITRNRNEISANSFIHTWFKKIDINPKESISYLEVGAFKGESLIDVFKYLSEHDDSVAFVIDVFEDPRHNYEKEFDKNIKNANLEGKVTKLKGDSRKEIPKLYGKLEFDIIFIDGNHSSRYVLSDAVNSWNILKEGGYLIFDDFFVRLRLIFIKEEMPSLRH